MDNEPTDNKKPMSPYIIQGLFALAGAVLGVAGTIGSNVLPTYLEWQTQLKQTKEQLRQTQDSLNIEQAKVVQLTIKLDSLNKSLNDCKKSFKDSVTKEKILSNLVKEGKQIKGNCTQPNIAKEFDKWKSKCINQLTQYIPNIQNRIEDIIKNAPPNNYCVKTESVICLLDSLKKQ